MTSLRALWLISTAIGREPSAVISRYLRGPLPKTHSCPPYATPRRFPRVESRVRLSQPQGTYFQPPPDVEFVRLFMDALAARASPTKQALIITKKAVSSSPSSLAPPSVLSLGPVVFISRQMVPPSLPSSLCFSSCRPACVPVCMPTFLVFVQSDGSELYFVGLPEVNVFLMNRGCSGEATVTSATLSRLLDLYAHY